MPLRELSGQLKRSSAAESANRRDGNQSWNLIHVWSRDWQPKASEFTGLALWMGVRGTILGDLWVTQGNLCHATVLAPEVQGSLGYGWKREVRKSAGVLEFRIYNDDINSFEGVVEEDLSSTLND